MKLLRSRSDTTQPGLVGSARLQRGGRARSRIGAGDVVVVDQVDMDRASAEGFVDAGVVAVVNTSPLFSGRYPSLGPEVLADAGVVLIDGLGAPAWSSLREGMRLRLHEGAVYLGDELLAQGREVDLATVREEMSRAREQMTTQLESFTHNSTELLRREEDLLLHGRGIPELATPVAQRPVMVVADGPDTRAELVSVRRYLHEEHPVLVAVDGAAHEVENAGLTPDIVVLSSGVDVESTVAGDLLRRSGEILVCTDRGNPGDPGGELERLGVRAAPVETRATAEDVALLTAHAHDASLIVGVGMHATLDEFLDRRRAGLASTFLARLRVGDRLVEAAAVPALYTGRVRPVHLLVVLLAALVALGAAVAITPLGQEWTDTVTGIVGDGYDFVRGLL